MRKVRILILILFVCGCSNRMPTPLPGHGSGVPAGELLFRALPSSAQLKKERRDFIQNTRLARRNPECPGIVTLNAKFSTYQRFVGSGECAIAAPTLEPYHGPIGSSFGVWFAASLPRVFWPHIPSQIQTLIRQRDITSLELWVVLQDNYFLPGREALLKSHFWAKPDLGFPDHFKGDVFNKRLLIGVFEPSSPITSPNPGGEHVRVSELTSHHVSIHEAPGKSGISPNDSLLDLQKGQQVTFYSLVIDDSRAVVTYHGVHFIGNGGPLYLPKSNRLNAIIQDAAVVVYPDLIQALEAEPLFQDGLPNIPLMMSGLNRLMANKKKPQSILL